MTITINDNPVVVTLTPEDLLRLAGASPGCQVFRVNDPALPHITGPVEVNQGDTFQTLCFGAIPPKAE